MESNPFKRPSMAAIVSIVLIAAGCSEETASPESSAPAPQTTSQTKSSSAHTATDQPVAGHLRDSEFTLDQAILNPGTLVLRQGSEFFADLAAEIVIFDEDPAATPARKTT